ncbi:ABC transporter ATP-binding protein [Paractinoplanes brasiliensis]|uniref:NitT/TauT family transport system ATP-binding protein n=1 Tax=Paractinoplanes brasiliensis TaxID=52695 RepID=A0A4R6K230_9ACTN|nr:ABC transporter ATP-binding protein [Actinoplanes brasiliensis]TDO42372.1 NitT/TauT family transport system ATP-binding protein [Actinoplanes brasiliensis]GID29605.1 sulfonate ABC transporter ATP-binding lipoprotein [Actinoplanes brasiliensis]
MTAVRVEGVTKIFNQGRTDEVVALSDVDLTVGQGEFVSLIGPSGCGKSTLLRLIADLIAPSAGTVTVAGKTAAAARKEQAYGIAFQQAGLFEWRTVLKNVELPLELRGLSRAERKAKAEEMLALVGLEEFAGHYPAQLSGGMQQRVAIARALAVRPPLLLMDEPFGALDEMTRERLQSELLGICARTGTSTVFVTHSISEAVFLSDRVVVMSARPGRITASIPISLESRDEAGRQSDRYFECVTTVRQALRGTPVAAAPVPSLSAQDDLPAETR